MDNKPVYTIYTDGSYCSGRKLPCSWGVLVIESVFSEETEIVRMSGLVKEAHLMSSRNLGGEVKAVMIGIQYCVDNNINEFKICYDYSQLGKWITGKSKTKSPVATIYKSWVVGAIKKHNLKIEFEEIKSHNGNKYNELVDEIAKQALNENK